MNKKEPQEEAQLGSKNDKGDDTMSAVASNFVYRVTVAKGKEPKIPVISKEKLEAFKADVAKYRHKK